MVASSADEAVANAKSFSSCEVGQCLRYTRTWLEIPSQNSDAAMAWRNAEHRHPNDRQAPRGAPVFWTGGSQGYGHIALSLGGGDIRTTDAEYAGQVSNVSLGWIEQHWSMPYVGWSEDLNGIWVPWLKDGGQSKYASGDVYVEKLVKGQKDSDSVGRLCYRLMHHPDMPGTHTPPNQVDNYGEEILEAVRYWQRNIMDPGTGGPTDGTKMSNAQANRLFGDNYSVHEK